MSCAEVVKEIARIRDRYRETDPFLLCGEMGIVLLPQPLGREEDAIKGFYLCHSRIHTITYNTDLPDVLQRVVVSHELGHARLHASADVRAFHDVGLFDESSRYEKEANLFAAELLLEDEKVLATLNADNTFFSAAASLNVPTELLDFKFRVMKWKGYKLVEPPITADSGFLKDLKAPEYRAFGNEE